MGYAIINMEGRITVDPEFRQNDRGQYCTFGFAVNERFGEQEIVSFYDCVANGLVCDRIAKAKLGKGSHIAVVGKLTIREYQRKQDGQMAKSANVGLMDFFFVESKKKDGDQQSQGAAPQQQTPPQAQYTPPATPATGARPADVNVSGPDDLPL